MAATSAPLAAPDPDKDSLIACHECDLLHRKRPLPHGDLARCRRCGAVLYRAETLGLQLPLALSLTALMLLLLANAFPILVVEFSGRREAGTFYSAVEQLWGAGLWPLALLVFATSMLAPFLQIGGLLTVLGLTLAGRARPWTARLYRWTRLLTPWSMLEVYLLALLVALVKLRDLVDLAPGIAFFAFALLILVMPATQAALQRSDLWERLGRQADLPRQPSALPPEPAGAGVGDVSPSAAQGGSGAPVTAVQAGLIACHHCRLLSRRPTTPGPHACPRCGARLHVRKPEALSRTWAWMIAASILYVPANTLPIMTVTAFGRDDPSTILGGILLLWQLHMWPLAILVFVASFLVPLAKLAVLALLLITVQRRSAWGQRHRTLLFRLTEIIGRWSMLDVFVVAILGALVAFGNLANIHGGPGATAFGAVVVLTMLAAQSFDPRLIWDHGAPATETDPRHG